MDKFIELKFYPGVDGGGTGVTLREKRMVVGGGYLESLLTIRRELLQAADRLKNEYDARIAEKIEKHREQRI